MRLIAYDETNDREVKSWSLDGIGAWDRMKLELEAIGWIARNCGDDVVMKEAP